MIALYFTDPAAIQLGSIGYSCGPVLMILNRMKGLFGVLVFSSSQVSLQLDVGPNPHPVLQN
jgi:hypothetical protein